MIRRFSIYILWEVGALFLVALVAFTTLIMLFGVVQQLLAAGIGPMAIVQVIPFILPFALQFALPATILFAVCSVYGRISADNEVVALKAAGVTPFKIISPALYLGLMISPVAVWFNDLAVSWGEPGIVKVAMHSIEEVAYRFLATQGHYSGQSGFSISVDGIGPDGREMIAPRIRLQSSSGGPATEISARIGWLKLIPETEMLHIGLVDSRIIGGNADFTHPGPNEIEIPWAQAARKRKAVGNPTTFALRQISSEVHQQREMLRRTEEIMAARTAFGLTAGRYDWLDDSRTDESIGKLIDGRKRLNKLYTEPWRRWAAGFSCFFFVWVGIPFAIWRRNADYWTSFGMCFLPIVLLYYPFFALGLSRSKDGAWPPYSVWLGNLVLLAIGAWLMRKVYRN